MFECVNFYDISFIRISHSHSDIFGMHTSVDLVHRYIRNGGRAFQRHVDLLFNLNSN